MASTSVTNPATVEADIVSALLMKPFSVRSITEQNVIVKERPTPNLTIKNKGRSFQKEWYCKKDWLCGSSALEKLFCWPCLLFSPGTSPTWTRNGYNDMRSLMSDGKKHEKGKSHLSAFNMENIWGKCSGGFSFSQARRDEIQRHNEEVRQNREILKTVTEAVLYLSKQELAFRGHDESEDSLNKGNYRELLESFAKFDSVFDSVVGMGVLLGSPLKFKMI